MKFLASLALAGAAVAAPLTQRAGITDVDVLQFALVLEHLENVFYKGAIQKFSEADFAKAGFSDFYLRNLKFIAHDEESHVDLLEKGLTAAGSKPNQACTYSFPYTDVKSFVGLSGVLEGVGTSAYLGAAPAITSKDYLTIAGSILVTEAKHTSLQRYNLGQIAPENPYGTPLGPNEVFTLAAAFIKSCPAGNYALPFKAFPSLAAEIGTLPQVGQTHITAFSTKATVPAGAYLTFISGLDVTSVKATKDSKTGYYNAAVPESSFGQTYVVLTKADAKGVISDSNVIAGPAILEVCSGEPTLNFSDLK
ncbi:MAG: hypothetical protein GOMPHAMPRED_000067 [Gomphillus americanus]|uniref:Uncharacterized protein n=1 Tax=Gomphillus americanus TaxID=1940652 RepID=A0A8H3I100_9LECA|nr:MAG: hypothetical protein GOMPHAMPRED_000067 [Gomphillus americanus]